MPSIIEPYQQHYTQREIEALTKMALELMNQLDPTEEEE